jgi:diguanylate cyclase (GGDEF)-like protein
VDALPPLEAISTGLIPLRARGRLIGALAVGLAGRDAQALQLARRLVARIAGPFERVLLAATLKAAAQAAEQTTDLDATLRAILAGLRRVVPADGAGILVPEGEVARVIAVDGHPDGAVGHLLPISEEMGLAGPLRRGVPARIDDPQWGQAEDTPPGVERIRSYLGVPVHCGAEIVAVLCLDGWQPGAFDAGDLRRACQFADHVGTLMARTRTQLLSRAEAGVLREVAQLAVHDPGADDMVPRILDSLRRVVACDGASVLLREGDRARIVAAHGHPASVRDYGFPIAGHRALETPLLLGHPFLTPDLSAEPSYEPAPGAMRIRGHLSVPLVARGEILGMLAVDSRRLGAFGPEDCAHVELFAGYAATALLNARMHQAIRLAADTDPVTGLLNHRAIHDHLDRELANARLTNTPLTVAMLDLDGFKLFNDTYGHPAGDAALQAVARGLAEVCRQGDLVGRYGGDEFLAVLPGLAAHEAGAVGARLRDAVAACTLRPRRGQEVPLRISAGLASFPEDGDDRDSLVAYADARLYGSKGRGEVAALGAEQPAMVALSGRAPGLDAFSILDGLITAVDRKDRYTRAHSEEVTRLALRVGSAIGLSPDTLRSLRLAGLLHDVGKIGIPDRILKKPGRLSADEIEIMNSHPTLGDAIVASLPGMAQIRSGVRSHHERWDGRGYPDGLAGEAIPLLGRLLAVADCYNAMTTNRPYQAALSPEQALAEIERGAGSQFDPSVAATFLRIMREAAPTPLQ